MSGHLFDEFPPVSARQWKQKIQMDLKGAPYDTLITHTPEGIDIRPFYHRDEYLTLSSTRFPEGFHIITPLHGNSGEEDIRQVLERAVDAVSIVLPAHLSPRDLADYRNRLYIHARLDRINEARAWLEEGFKVFFAPLSYFTRYGNWSVSGQWDDMLRPVLAQYPSAFVSVDGALFADAGAHLSQQIAYTLAQSQEYIRRLGKEFIRQIRLEMATGSRYMAEIAKLRALRYLWEDPWQTGAWIHTRPTLRNKSFLDPYTNMLRTGMEMMAALQGGSNEMTNLPYDYLTATSPESQRLADNQLIILREEVRMEGLHASDGSYFFDELSYRMAAKAADILEQLEKGGGYVAQLHKGTIQSQIARSADAQQQKFDKGELVLIGVNKYPRPDEPAVRPLPHAFAEQRQGKTLIRPVIPRRLAEKKEKAFLKKKSS